MNVTYRRFDKATLQMLYLPADKSLQHLPLAVVLTSQRNLSDGSVHAYNHVHCAIKAGYVS